MKRNWEIAISSEGGGSPSSYTLSLGIRDPEKSELFHLLISSSSLDDFEKEVFSVKGEMDQLLEQAKEKVGAFQKKGTGKSTIVPEEIWQKMETCASEEEMFRYFNSFSESDKEKIAEYIFTHVSMFKGRGVVFAQHYDTVSHSLD